MTTLDDTLRPTAQRLIGQYGKTVTYTRVTQSAAYDPTAGAQAQSSVDTDLAAVVSGFSAYEMRNGLVENGDLKLMLYDMDAPPTNADNFTVDGVTYNVVNVAATYSGSQRAYFEIQARRA